MFVQEGGGHTREGDDRAHLTFLPPYLNAGGGHLGRLVVDPEPVPACGERVVTDQVLDGRVLDLRGVKGHAAIGVTQGPMAPRVTLGG